MATNWEIAAHSTYDMFSTAVFGEEISFLLRLLNDPVITYLCLFLIYLLKMLLVGTR